MRPFHEQMDAAESLVLMLQRLVQPSHGPHISISREGALGDSYACVM